MKISGKFILKVAGTLTVIALVVAALLGLVNNITADKIAEVMKALEDGSVKVFDTATFTVNGETVTTYLADVDDLGDYVGETEAISDGAFLESFYRSAPYFDLDIDGITNLDA